MKKIYAFAVSIMAFSTMSFAQRTIDWTITEVLEPTELFSNEQTGTLLPVKIVLKNNGPDEAKIGDTLVYQFVCTDPSNNPIIAYPSTSSLALRTMTRNVASGDTMHLTLSGLSVQLFTRNSFNLNFNMVCYLWNRGGTDPVKLETDFTNNRITKQVVWWNPYKNGVGIEQTNNGGLLNVYPNPATTTVNVSWPIASTGSAAKVTVTDLQGRVVISSTLNNFSGVETLNVSDLNAGLYMVEVSAGEVTMSQKLQVIK